MTISYVVLLIGVILIVLGSFGVQVGPARVEWLGTAIAFAAGLVRA